MERGGEEWRRSAAWQATAPVRNPARKNPGSGGGGEEPHPEDWLQRAYAVRQPSAAASRVARQRRMRVKEAVRPSVIQPCCRRDTHSEHVLSIGAEPAPVFSH